ncbi:MAG TPA: hypothetical protein VE775_06515 [Pyrinomonadaceae bacterium]|nr:hypothetical protein [Pyrinomonadaceae bacterium]
MMTKTHLQVVALAAVLSALGALSGVAHADGPDTTLKEIAGYKQWTRMQDKPLQVLDPSVMG